MKRLMDWHTSGCTGNNYVICTSNSCEQHEGLCYVHPSGAPLILSLLFIWIWCMQSHNRRITLTTMAAFKHTINIPFPVKSTCAKYECTAAHKCMCVSSRFVKYYTIMMATILSNWPWWDRPQRGIGSWRKWEPPLATHGTSQCWCSSQWQGTCGRAPGVWNPQERSTVPPVEKTDTGVACTYVCSQFCIILCR